MKIIKSAVIVLSIAVIAGGATYSFFSDEEKSVGNTFTAGEIDLQIDSESHYNGMVCKDEKWVADCTPKGDDLISNGSFETGTDPGSFATLSAGNSNISDWTIESGEVDYIGSYWPAFDPSRSIDLNGFEKGSISQTFTTVDGATYKVSFNLSGNPENRSDTNDPLYSPSDKVMTVSATGASPTDFNYDTSVENNTLADMKWKNDSYTFVATGTSTTLTFASQIPGAFGPALDNVDVHELDCPLLPTQDLLGTECHGTWPSTSLTDEKFFDFSDIKPGDLGEDTISFKILDNSAWMCADLNVTDNSELGQYLTIFWWVDTNGNNVYEDGEKLLYDGPQTINQWLTIGGDTGHLPLTFADSYLNWETWPTTPGNTVPIPANTTKYLGVGWCFGGITLTPGSGVGFTCDASGDQNDAQGKKVVADLTFSVEQSRNNPNFLCPEHKQ